METNDKYKKVSLPEGVVLVNEKELKSVGKVISFNSGDYIEKLNKIKTEYEEKESQKIESHLWALCAKVDKENFVFLEIGSVGDNKNAYTTEIEKNINFMFMSEENVLKKFERQSHFFKSEWKYDGCEGNIKKKKLKYRDMSRKFSEFMLIIITEGEMIKIDENKKITTKNINLADYNNLVLNSEKISKQRCTEVILAHKYHPLYWHPFGKEWNLLRNL